LRPHLNFQVFNFINSPAGQIMRSKLIVYNEMFSYVNIFSGPLTPAINLSGAGNILAWKVGNWNYTRLPAFSILIQRDLSKVLSIIAQ